MKKYLLLLLTYLFVSFTYSQSWSDPIITDCNMTVLIQYTDLIDLNISLNNDLIPAGSTLAAFYTNDNNELVCGGSTVLTMEEDENQSIAIFGTEAGLDNGFAIGEEITWILFVGNQIINMDENGATMNPVFTDLTYTCNGMGSLAEVNFEGDNIEISYGCTDESACNYDDTVIIDDSVLGESSCTYSQIWYLDQDGDGLGDPNNTTESCFNLEPSYVTNGDDTICPDGENNPNNIDTWYLDQDEDGLGDPNPDTIVESCDNPN